MPETLGGQLALLLSVAWLLPLLGFGVEVFGGHLWGRLSKTAAYMAVACIGFGFVCSAVAFVHWGTSTDWVGMAGHDTSGEEVVTEEAGEGEESESTGHATDHAVTKTVFSGTFYRLAKFGDLDISLDYYIDSLTLAMFMMVTFIATCIHVFAIGYMSDELTEDHVDHQVHTSDGGHFHRPGRFYQFFSYMSLFSFSMLGLVLAGNIFQVFIFWELVGICSYLLIGFYVERKSASNAANKAFIVNRVGDFGFLIGLMIIITSFGTFRFAAPDDNPNATGLFAMLRGQDGHMHVEEYSDPETGATKTQVVLNDAHGAHDPEHSKTIPYALLVVAGLGIFGGCVGKSAQFPLQTWLPDAMEGPTPVSALVHSATMVAAGVYLAGRFYPMFAPEVLLTIAYVGCITLFLAATIAIVATDIKRVLAYSTISQLGYMMLAIGVGGWVAGLFHLITHAFFKSLMFLASGSVIVGCHHEQEMTRMGGLRKKMPITAYTMLVGVIAISGLAIPGTAIAFSGYHSKDAIVATALAYTNLNSTHFLLFFVPLITAGLTAFYMFRLWFYTFAGKPRDEELYDHVHESPWVMTAPLVVLALFAAFCAFGGENGPLYHALINSEPVGVAHGVAATAASAIALPSHHAIEAVHHTAGLWALIAAASGTLIAYLVYGKRIVDAADIKHQMQGLHTFLAEKWWFDELYDAMFVRPVRVVARFCAAFDRIVIDGILHGAVRITVWVSTIDRKFDEGFVDGLVNLIGNATYTVGRSFRVVQTGLLRQYVMFIGVGVVALFLLLFLFLPQ